MKVLVAYDGSAGADAALEDLGRAGLPDVAAVLVLTVAHETIRIPEPLVALAGAAGAEAGAESAALGAASAVETARHVNDGALAVHPSPKAVAGFVVTELPRVARDRDPGRWRYGRHRSGTRHRHGN